MKFSTVVIRPTSVAVDNIDMSRVKDQFCWHRYLHLFESISNWRINHLLEESSLNTLIRNSGNTNDTHTFFTYLDDIVNYDFDDSYYFEIPMSLWYILKNRKKLFAGKNVIISQPRECFFIGLKCDQLIFPNNILQDVTVLSDLDVCRSATVVWDNIDARNNKRFPNINWIPSNNWLPEYSSSQYRLMPNAYELRENIRKNVLHQKKHNFVALLGKPKNHRIDFAQRVVDNNMHNDNEIGTNILDEHDDYMGLVLKYEEKTNLGNSFDRNMSPEWISDCKVWVSMETVYNDCEISDDSLCFSQLTEKTFKAMAYGMPFLLNGGYGIFEYIERLGFKTFTDVFGNYAGATYQETNNNIINILKKIDSYDLGIIADHCEHNHDTLMSWTTHKTLSLLLSNLEKIT